MSFTKSTLLLATAGLAQIAAAAYSVLDDYSGDKFFDMFTFDTVRSPKQVFQVTT